MTSSGTGVSGAPRKDLTIAILGAGASGLCMAIAAKRAGFHGVTIYEKSDGVGGTWRDNTYPGAGCDVPSHLYSFSFAPKPDWSHKFSEQPEILAYFEKVADDFGLRPHLRTHSAVTAAAFDAEAGLWRLTLGDGSTATAHVLVSGVGQLNRPYTAEIPGRESFGGLMFHSARWDHGAGLQGKRIAVIGNGASAVQFVPRIAPAAAHLTVFQRSANWIIPRNDRAYTAFEKQLFASVPPLRAAYREWIYWQLEKNFWAFRQDTLLGRLMEKAARKHLEAQVADPRLRALLTPDYAVGCKRILISDDYYPALQRPNVSVVDGAIARITRGGVETADGRHHPADVIIWGTGFETTDFLSPIEITGLGGVSLNAAWAKGAEAYLGVVTAGFPNFFMLYGPNTNLGHNSIIFMIEAQVNYALQLVNRLWAERLRWIAVKPEAQAAYNATLQAELGRTVWAAGCKSWYKTADGRVTNNWSGFTRTYAQRTAAPEPAAFLTA